MKTIAVLIALLAMIAPALAFPPMPWIDNPSIAKVQIYNGDGSTVGVYVWFNNDTRAWEARVGTDTWQDSTILPVVFKGDHKGLIEVPIGEMLYNVKYGDI